MLLVSLFTVAQEENTKREPKSFNIAENRDFKKLLNLTKPKSKFSCNKKKTSFFKSQKQGLFEKITNSDYQAVLWL